MNALAIAHSLEATQTYVIVPQKYSATNSVCETSDSGHSIVWCKQCFPKTFWGGVGGWGVGGGSFYRSLCT